MSKYSAQIYLGRIQGVYGVKGWVKLYSECRPRSQILNYPYFLIQDGSDIQTQLYVAERKCQSRSILVRFDGVEDRDNAYALNGLALYIPRELLPQPAANEYYWADLIGLHVVNQHGEVLGKVSSLFETGANDVMVVTNDSGIDILIPFVIPTYICEIDMIRCVVKVDWELEWSG